MIVPLFIKQKFFNENKCVCSTELLKPQPTQTNPFLSFYNPSKSKNLVESLGKLREQRHTIASTTILSKRRAGTVHVQPLATSSKVILRKKGKVENTKPTIKQIHEGTILV